MLLLGILDFLFVSHAYHSILTRGASVQLVFGFEVSKLALQGLLEASINFLDADNTKCHCH